MTKLTLHHFWDGVPFILFGLAMFYETFAIWTRLTPTISEIVYTLVSGSSVRGIIMTWVVTAGAVTLALHFLGALKWWLP